MMAAKRTPSDGMKKMYAKKREATLTRIRTAIRDMKSWGEPVTKKKLMELAQVSSGTLSKPYVLELLAEEGVCQFKNGRVPTAQPASPLQEISRTEKEKDLLRRKITIQSDQLARLRKQKEQAEEALRLEKEENERLRGQRQLLLERLFDADISIGNIKI